MPDDPTVLSLVAPLGSASLEQVHQLVTDLFAAAEVDEMIDRIRFETAVIEVAGNIVEHSLHHDPPSDVPRTFDIVLRGSSTTLTAEFRDDGRPVEIDFEKISMPSEDAERGRGLALALATVDEITHSRSDGLNIWCIVCHRSS